MDETDRFLRTSASFPLKAVGHLMQSPPRFSSKDAVEIDAKLNTKNTHKDGANMIFENVWVAEKNNDF